MRLGRDGIAGLTCLAISLLLLPLSFGLPKLAIVPIGPGFYPAIVLVFMAVTSVALIVQDAAAQRKAATLATDAATRPRRAYDLVAAAFAVVVAYIGLLPLFGFRIATALFVAAFQLALERPATARQWVILVAIAAGTSAVTYILFERYLLVLLTRGLWTGW